MTTQNKFIVVKNRQMLKRIELRTLYAITCDGYCSTFCMDNQEKFTCCKTLKEIESLLPSPYNYIRISKNAIINVAKVLELHCDRRVVGLKNGTEFQVSVRKMKNIKQALATTNRLN
jgi:DNA-binding LytR/AlgR family response regulator